MGKQTDIDSFADRPGGNGQSNTVYAAMLKSVDDSVGRLLKTLDDLGIASNTIVIFTSDNGGAVHLGKPPATSNAPHDYATRSDALPQCAQKVFTNLTRRDLKLVPPAGLKGKELNQWLSTKPTEVALVADGKTNTLTGAALDAWKYQRYMQDYLACVQSVDDNVGRLVDWLDASGLGTNMVVIYIIAQEFFLGEHGLYDKRFMYDPSIRMPFIVRWPAVIKPGGVQKLMAINPDFAPTFMDIAGLKTPADMQGRSLLPLLKNQTPENWRTSYYYRYYHDPGDHNTRA